MDNKKPNPDRKKANRLLYMVIVAALCITALVIGLTAAFGRGGKPAENAESRESESEPTTEKPTEESRAADVEPEKKDVLLLSPLSGVVSKEHSGDVLVYSLTMNDYRVHEGMDIAAAAGSGVYASAAGTVTRVWEDPMMGTCVSIDHGQETVTVYKNLAKTLADGIVLNAAVKAGQLIGAVGDSAMLELAEEPHLHFEVWKSNVQVDPLTVLSPDSVATCLSGSDAVED